MKKLISVFLLVLALLIPSGTAYAASTSDVLGCKVTHGGVGSWDGEWVKVVCSEKGGHSIDRSTFTAFCFACSANRRQKPLLRQNSCVVSVIENRTSNAHLANEDDAFGNCLRKVFVMTGKRGPASNGATFF